jgi:hypothetical protein
VIEQRNYAHISSYVFKAEGALDTASAAAASNAAPGSNNISAAPPPKKSAERDQVQSKLDFAMALFHLGQANYEKAAQLFLKIGPPDSLGDWIGKVGEIFYPANLCLYSSSLSLPVTLRYMGLFALLPACRDLRSSLNLREMLFSLRTLSKNHMFET